MNTAAALIIITAAILAGALLAIPYLIQDPDIFHPLGFVGLQYLLALGGPMLDLATQPQEQTTALLLGSSLEYVVWPAILVLMAMLGVVVGYRLGPEVSYPAFPTTWNHRRAQMTSIFFGIIGFVSLIVYLRTTGGVPTSLTELSVHRSPPTRYLGWGVSFLFFGTILGFVSYLDSGKSIFCYELLPIICMWGLYTAYAIYRSSRSTLLFSFLILLMCYHYRRRAISLGKGVIAGIISITVASVMFGLRTYTQYNEGNILAYLSPTRVLETVFGANKGHFVAFSHLYHYVPEKKSFEYGTTFFEWIVFPIPRSIWSGKPTFLGRDVAIFVYGRPNTATPPTMIGEFYLNFGTIGVLILPVFFGVFLRGFYSIFKSERSLSAAAAVLYVVLVTRVANLGLITPMVISTLLWSVPITVALLFITEQSLSSITNLPKRMLPDMLVSAWKESVFCRIRIAIAKYINKMKKVLKKAWSDSKFRIALYSSWFNP